MPYRSTGGRWDPLVGALSRSCQWNPRRSTLSNNAASCTLSASMCLRAFSRARIVDGSAVRSGGPDHSRSRSFRPDTTLPILLRSSFSFRHSLALSTFGGRPVPATVKRATGTN